MFSFLSNFFHQKGIELIAPIRLRDCKLQKPYLLERAGITSGTVFLIAVPYFTADCLDPRRNLSAYAVSRDYHLFFADLFGELLPLLKEKYPHEQFACFADHSPISEGEAAARAGLGVIGKNGLLITEKYSSYVFLGEIVTSAEIPDLPAPVPISSCMDCGKCRSACPMNQIGECLSAMTQKKGELTQREAEAICKFGSVWGCDLCQEICPHTRRAIEKGSIFTPIPFFSQHALPHLTASTLAQMPDDELEKRAYAWRGRQTIERNLLLIEKNTEKR